MAPNPVLSLRRQPEEAVWGVAPGDPAAAPDAAEVSRRSDWGPQEVQEGPVGQTADRQEGGPGVSWGGRRAAEAGDRAAECGADAVGAGS